MMSIRSLADFNTSPPGGAVTGSHRHRHRPGPKTPDDTREGWGLLTGHQRRPRPGHTRGLSRALPRILWCWLRWVQDDAPAKQGEAGAAVHLAFDGLDLVDDALDPARAVGEGEPVEDGFLVAADPVGEGAELGLAVGCLDGCEPGVEVRGAGEAVHHLGERGDVAGEGVDVGAFCAYPGDLFPLGGFQVVWPGQQAGDL